jgi:hypothetical protein
MCLKEYLQKLFDRIKICIQRKETYHCKIFRNLYSIETPLMVAAREGNDQIVRILVNKCSTADINFTVDANIILKRRKSYMMWNGLEWCCQSSDCILGECYSWSCFFSYCRKKSRQNDYSYRYRDLDCDRDQFGRTALWSACFYGHLNVVRTLIEIGNADIHLSDDIN